MAIIKKYDPIYKSYFVSLNTEWLEKYFVVESSDVYLFENIETLILDKGGEIFFCVVDDVPVGTVAVKPDNEGKYELSKMAVDPNHQGKGYANLLIDASIEFVKQKNSNSIYLFSNTILGTAIKLYRKYGFYEIPIIGSNYKRTNIKMQLDF